MSTKLIENMTITRDFQFEPGVKDGIFETIRISVDLYLINEVEYQITRWYIIFGGMPNSYGTRQGTTTVSTETYLDKEEAVNAFSTQCVKAFTQQVTWNNAHKLAQKQKEVQS